MENWQAMISAPRDGTWIAVLSSDGSGIEALRWEEHFYTGSWYDMEGTLYSRDEMISGAGWVALPPILESELWSKRQAA